MKKTINVDKMKAVILAAGVGSRIKPLTDNHPKILLKVGDNTILEMMISNIQDCGINEVIFVVGYLKEQIKDYVKTKFPDLNVNFVTNDKYAETNTGYSLMLVKDFIQNSGFIKFDGDVVFDKEILKKLIECKQENCLCIYKNIYLGAEEIKVIINNQNRILKVNKTVNPKDAVGESIGIDKICKETAKLLFKELELMMLYKKNHQEYYEGAYERLIKKNIPFYTLDISGLNWVEIDTRDDFDLGIKIFSNA